MGQVTVVPTCRCGAHSWALDPQAAQAAVDTLGIERPVLITPRDIGGGALGLMEGMDDFDRWLIEVDDTKHYPVGGRDLSYVLWHELGHVLDYEQQSKRTGEHPNICMEHGMEDYYRPLSAAMHHFRWSSYEWLERYREIPPERFADAIAEKYSPEHKLHVPIMRPAWR